MYPKVATAYDQNPTRIQLVVASNKKRARKPSLLAPTATACWVLTAFLVFALF
jgi:hypothetical protein